MRLSPLLSAAPDALPAPGQWHPFPASADRAAWSGLDPGTAAAFVDEARRLAGTPWPALPASLWLRFADEGVRVPYEEPYFARRHRLATEAVGYAISPRPDLLADLIDGICAVLEETTWCLPAHDFSTLRRSDVLPDPQLPYVDLMAAETAALLAFTDLIVGAELAGRSPVLRRRIGDAVRERVLRPYRRHTDWFWYQDKPNNWNPWIHANLIAAALLLDDPAELPRTVGKALRGLDHYLAALPADGGCDEGAGYWWLSGACLFECLEWLYDASAGQLDAFSHPQLVATARFPLIAHIADGWRVNFADGAARASRSGTDSGGETPELLYRFGTRIGDPQVRRHARALRGQRPATPLGDPLGRILPSLFNDAWHAEPPAAFPRPAQSWLPDTQVLTARQEAGSDRGLFLAAKAGHNGENHNHNDVGTVIIAVDGDPVVIDVGVGEYTGQTFSERRYDIWTMTSSYHNVPEVGGIAQAAGRGHAAERVEARLSPDAAALGLDLTAAYPDETGLSRLHRSVVLDRGAAAVEVTDDWRFAGPPRQLAWHFMLRTPPAGTGASAAEDGLLLRGGDATCLLSYPAGELTARWERVPTSDPKLAAAWGDAVTRLTFETTRRAPAGQVRFRFRAIPEGADR